MTTFARVLIAVDDSPAALDATALALDLAAESGAAIRAVTVAENGTLAAMLDQSRSDSGALSRITGSAHALLGHLTGLAQRRGIAIETAQLFGEPFRAILDDARTWRADLIVMGRSDRRGPASPYVGSEVEHVLEFCDTPVLVVPQAAKHRPDPATGDR